MNIHIRPETAADAKTIELLTTAAFLNAPHTDHTEQFVVNALRAAGVLTVSLVAMSGETMVGHVALSPVALSDGSSGWYGLGPISVWPEHQGQGIGSDLMHEALQALRARAAAGCVLLGDPAYYGRFGFKADPALVLAGVPPEYFQALRFGSAVPTAVVTYHAAFNAQA
ncbi:GNAT family N-acetyltransferase [Rhodoferax saidenbachensis]|uniref:N-acetyltransferase n=1 Tax=Rhodoferax saidenbachensis TaxID=1484693 RepID=A0A1P8K9E4_9BURK|nr:N-acetyltransferase [Rhodoferax saidenbachensis]APW42627.1 N-acetyltransferase [Rhodoferax saidenbachensis]